MALGYIIIRSPYTPYSIYLRGTIPLASWTIPVTSFWTSDGSRPSFSSAASASCLASEFSTQKETQKRKTPWMAGVRLSSLEGLHFLEIEGSASRIRIQWLALRSPEPRRKRKLGSCPKLKGVGPKHATKASDAVPGPPCRCSMKLRRTT